MDQKDNNMIIAGSSNAPAPESPKNNLIFGELKDFGLEEAALTQVFGTAVELGKGSQLDDATMRDIANGLYYKTFKCPICGEEEKLPAVRSSSVRIIQTESDFMPVYKDPNPLYYFVDFCRHCGFAGMSSTIKNLKPAQKKLLLEKIAKKWKFDKIYPAYYDPQTAIEIHKLALYNAVVAGEKEGARSVLCLHIAWLYRILKDEENERSFLLMALEGFERAYSAESEPIGGLDKSSQQYLVGELMRRTGNMTGALNWFKLVLIDRDANNKVKDMARNQKDRITAFYASGGKFQ